MPLLKGGQPVNDSWQRVADGDQLPEGGIIVSLERWQSERETLLARGQPLGVALPNTTDVAPLQSDLVHFGVIVLHLPKFTDGRAYSQARRLRDQLGFAGELRVTGQILPDQIFFLQRVGFDAFETDDPRVVARWAETQAPFSAVYQPAADGRRAILSPSG